MVQKECGDGAEQSGSRGVSGCTPATQSCGDNVETARARALSNVKVGLAHAFVEPWRIRPMLAAFERIKRAVKVVVSEISVKQLETFLPKIAVYEMRQSIAG